MAITEKVKTPRTILSATKYTCDGKLVGGCKFKCRYCFAKDPKFIPNKSVLDKDTYEYLSDNSGKYKVVLPACDTELFQYPETAKNTLEELAKLKVDITFSTKMILSKNTIDWLSNFQHKLNEKGNFLSIMVSIPMLINSAKEELYAPPPELRIKFLKNLYDNELYPYIGIRPLLPPNIVSDEEIAEITRRTYQNSYGYIIGPYWFKEDTYNLLGNKDIKIQHKKVPWMEDETKWYLYEDKERERRLAALIKENGGTMFERSSEALKSIKDSVLANKK